MFFLWNYYDFCLACREVAIKSLFGHFVCYIGKNCFTWMGTKPVVHVSEPTMIRDVLANYGKFQKPRGGNPLTKLLARGLIDAETDQWVKQRKIINPAFHVEKLKVSCSGFFIFLFQDV